ncbi:hypothetical protein BHM03_00006635 [Ensete ventricosum]|nr:hypothetical protein BHM03_00006635 [Ensete ventricosum]
MGTGAAVVWQEAVARRRGLVSRQGWRSREDKAREDVIHSPAKSLTARFESGGNLLPATRKQSQVYSSYQPHKICIIFLL